MELFVIGYEKHFYQTFRSTLPKPFALLINFYVNRRISLQSILVFWGKDSSNVSKHQPG